jgi:hypothetical protein
MPVAGHFETAASRLVLGYITQEMYYVPHGVIGGATNLARAQEYIKPDGSFTQARFRIRDDGIEEAGGWAFTSNRFVGTRERASSS